MKHRLGIAAVIGVCTAFAGAASHAAGPAKVQADGVSSATLSSGDRRHLLRDTFIESRRVADLRLPVKRAMAAGGAMSVADGNNYGKGKSPFRMANPDEPFQAGDAITDPTLPWSRLRFVATSGDYTVVEYETGGFAHFTTVALYRMPSLTGTPHQAEVRPARLLWKTNVRKMYGSWKELRTDIAMNAVK